MNHTGDRSIEEGIISYNGNGAAGTEAAAATAVMMRLTAMPGMPIEVKIDRLFIFLIRDIETVSILFDGRVMNPSA